MKSRSVKTLRILGASIDLAAFGSQMPKVYSNIRSFSQSIGRATACLVALYIFAVMAGAAGTYTPATLGTKSTSNARKDGNRAADTFFRVREYNVFDPALFYPISTAINNDRSDLGAFWAQVAASDNYSSFIVTNTADTNDGVCDANCTLREAITAANADAGKETISFNIAGPFPFMIQLASALPALSDDVDILNTSGRSITVRGLGRTGGFRIFDINAGIAVTISYLTINNGYDELRGGGVNNAGRLTLSNSIINFNASHFYGGGIYNSDVGTLGVTNSAIDSNFCDLYGGGIDNDGTLTVGTSTISRNNATSGGGILNFGTLTLANSAVFRNIALAGGAGVLHYEGSAYITNSTISENQGDAGVGLGGGIWVGEFIATLNITNSTITFNTADEGGGISSVARVPPMLGSNIIAENSSHDGDLDGVFISSGYNIIADMTSSNITATTGDQFGVDPKVELMQANGGPTQTQALLPGSPAIDKGKNFGSSTDQRGLPRSVDLANAIYPNAVGGDGTDIGAHEAQSAPVPDITPPTVASIVRATADPTSANNRVQFIVTFTETVTGFIGAYDVPNMRATKLTTTNLSGASIESYARSGSLDTSYTVTVNTGTVNLGQTSGTLRLDLVDDDSIWDYEGNRLGGTGVGSGDYSSGESYTVNAPDDYRVLTVSTTADTDDGVCDVADCSLREAITAANADGGEEQIQFNIPGAGPQTIQLTSALPALADYVEFRNTSGKSITVNGEGSADPYRIFTVNSGVTVRISDLTISNGFDTNGGGIYNKGTLVIVNSTISNNAAGFGGGILNTGTLTVARCAVTNNSTTSGGDGNGIYNSLATLTVNNSTLSNNSGSSGGGIYTFGGVVNVTHSTITANSGPYGGGIHNTGGTITVRSSIIAGNSATNGGPDLSGTIASSGYNLVGDKSGATITASISDQFGTAEAPIDPKLGPLQDNGGPTETFALLADSPALDKGKNFLGTLATDQRGLARTFDLANATYPNAIGGDGSDIGAYETQLPTPVITFGSAPTPVFVGGNFTVSATTTNTESGLLTYSLVSGPCALVSDATFSTTGTGTCVVKASGDQTANFGAASSTQNVTISKGTPVITFAAAPTPISGGNFTVSATTTNTDSSSLTYSRVSGPCALVSGATFSSSGPGICVVQASGPATTNFTAASNTQNVNISNLTPTITFSAAPAPIFGGGNFTVSASTTNTDSASLTYSRISGPCAFVSGATFSSSGAGTCVVQASGAATANFTAASNTQNVNISKATPTITFVAAPTPSFGANFTVSASTTNTDSSSLTYSVVSGPCAFVSGATFSATGVGPCVVQASGAATTNFNSGLQTQTVTIAKATPIITVSSSLNPSIFGQPVTFTATITAPPPGAGTPTGTITFKDNNVIIGTCAAQTVAANVATCSIITLSVGTHPITAVYNGDANFNVSTSNTVSQVVNKADTTTSVTSTPNPSVWGQSVTMTAIIGILAPGAGAPTGTVNFLDGGFPIPGCQSRPVSLVGAQYQANCTTSALPVGGPRLMNAVYSGDANFNGSNSPNGYTITVNKADTSIAVTSSSNPIVWSQSVTFTATIAVAAPGAGTPAGTITFRDNGVNIGSCAAQPVAANVATCTISTLTVGAHPISAVYNGDPSFNGSISNAVNQVVEKANTITTVVSSLNPSVFGQPVTFTATVAPQPPAAGTSTGTVSFNIDGNLYCVNTPLNVSGQASCTPGGLPALPVGVRNVVALYNGSANFNGSAGTLNYTVTKANTLTSILSDTPDPSLVNQPYTVTWSVAADPVQPNSGTPTGTVTVNGGTGGGICTAAVSAGGCQLTPTTVGTKTIQATYNGDANFNSNPSATTTHTVHLRISGVVINGVTNAPVSGVTINLNNCANLSTTTGPNGAYSFTGAFTGSCRLFPPLVNALLERIYPAVTDNITDADFVIYTSLGDFPRRISFPTQFVTPGSAGSMPVILKSIGNEGSVGFSFSYDINPFAQPPTVVCGANAPGCTITQNNSVFGKVGVTITPAGGVFTRPDGTPFDAPEQGSPEVTTIPKEIARINFQTLPTLAPSTDFVIGGDPTPRLAFETATNNPLLVVYDDPARVVFAQGKEGDVAGRNTGNGVVDATDVVQVRRFVTGLDTPVLTHNEFQRADAAPAATGGNGNLDATDVVQTRRYGAGLDTVPSAGGLGLLLPAVAPPLAVERSALSREISVGSTTTATGNRVSVPIELKANGDETAMSFTLRYDETKLGKPEVTLANVLAGVTLTYNTDEAGLIRVLIDANSPIAGEASREAMQLLNVSFNVAANAPSGETRIEIVDGVTSDNNARALDAKYDAGTITVFGPNPSDDGKGEKTTRRSRPAKILDMIEEG